MARLNGVTVLSIVLNSSFNYNFIGARSVMSSFAYPHHRNIALRQVYHGRLAFSSRTKYSSIYSSHNILPLERPSDPTSSYDSDSIHESAVLLQNWMRNKTSILCLTGAGMSTESGIPDYRGHKGSYFNGHKPVSCCCFIHLLIEILSTF